MVQKSMDYSCFMEESETQQVLQLKQLIICGKLHGELPAGFLSCFRHLPNELIIKIWSFLSQRELRGFRLVSKHWKALWEEHAKNRRKAITKLSLALDEDNGKLVLKAVANSYFGRQVDVPNSEENIQQAFSLITFPIVPDLFSINCLLLYGEAANERVLRLITKQDWIIHTVNAYLSSGVISDNIIGTCSSKLMKFVIDLDRTCIQNQPIALTDRCLLHLIRDEVVAIIPSYSKFTVNGINVALKAFFFRINHVTNAVNFFTARAPCGRLCLSLSEAVTAKKIGAISMIVNQVLVNRCYYLPDDRVGCNLKTEYIKNVGMVKFTYKNGDNMHEESSDIRQFCIEIASEEKILDYIRSSAIHDVIVHSASLDSFYKLSTSIGYPSDVSDVYSYNNSANQSDDYEYSGCDSDD
ncbi:unnamed protein product [Cercopithifilaria johnstoni]|uniref:F-box domain-containing protein n=1 Tax=Cercopithifilaria johnstoni TaxID=2874296 RepID=A0A8J2LWP8_9BILA|nr:unnamed protein product [Cercopithifilaria johnstoni]